MLERTPRRSPTERSRASALAPGSSATLPWRSRSPGSKVQGSHRPWATRWASERVRSSESVGASSTSTPRRWSAIARNTVSRRSGVAPAIAGAPAHSVSSAASSTRPW